MNLKKCHALPAYPNAAQFAATAKLLGVAAVAGIGSSCGLLGSGKPAAEKPLVFATSGLQTGTHDYKYVSVQGDTLQTLARKFYDQTPMENLVNGSHLRYDSQVDSSRIAAANRKLSSFNSDTPIPPGTKILLPGVTRVSYGS